MKFVKALRSWHRHLSFVFAGMVMVYAVSGIVMNHHDIINPHYTVYHKPIAGIAVPKTAEYSNWTATDVKRVLKNAGITDKYTKHYFPDSTTLKVFLSGRATVTVHLETGDALYEQLRKRPIMSDMVRLHYNPGKWWRYYSDLFAVALIVITVSGLFLVRGKRGVMGIGGIELLIGILIPLLFVLV